MIEGVKIKKLRVIPDQRGRLMEIFRCDDEAFEEFGQVYMTTAYPGVIKGWHYHKLQDDNFTCIQGQALFALYDPRENSPTRGELNDFIVSLQDPLLIHIPKGVYHGFKNIGSTEAVVINTVTKPYSHNNPDEYRLDAFDKAIGYKWDRRE
ncbi:MAG: dTDP-4-dehydrorhamnose 3,5-epimerase family protein [Candidatus Omnitrophica bacterium]|nr:dTDP-4-dehydrorhamnose 3,5-epimerase family protein [Candidatus Omnitrophota bacterium]